MLSKKLFVKIHKINKINNWSKLDLTDTTKFISKQIEIKKKKKKTDVEIIRQREIERKVTI